MRYEKIDRNLFIKNRKKFVDQMEPNSVAIFNSNDVYPTSSDGTIPFKQHSDIFYLSGVDQEESVLVLFPSAFEDKYEEILFLTKTNEHIAVWEGEKLDQKAALETSGIKNVFWLEQFEAVLKQVMAQADKIYLNTNEHLRGDKTVETREDRFIDWVKKEYPAHQTRKSAPILHRIRSIKEPEEIEIMQTACTITGQAFNRVLNYIKPGVWEFEVEAEVMHEFMVNRSSGFAYTPIVAAGKNACVLHYIENKEKVKDGDLILMDVGAEYANYCADMTRCVPANGKFTDRQKEIYNAVLRVKKTSEKLLVPGTFLGEYHKEVGELMTKELLSLGLLDKTDVKNQDPNWPAYKKYFMHGTSHFIGLDTHDVGLWTEPLKEGMVFTCEPGIYLLDESIGVRLEDDMVIQPSGPPKNLMGHIPIEIEEIEEIMNG